MNSSSDASNTRGGAPRVSRLVGGPFAPLSSPISRVRPDNLSDTHRSDPLWGDEGSAANMSSIDDGLEQYISVCVRVRPPVARELNGFRPFANIIGIHGATLTLTEAVEGLPAAPARTSAAPSSVFARQRFTFDVCYGPQATQAEVYEHSARPAISSLMSGVNATILAYGQTGTGKTFTMEGLPDEESRGIIPRAVEEIFATLANNLDGAQQCSVRASYLQIYNEVLSDLLEPPAHGDASRRPLCIRHTPQTGVVVEGLSEWIVRSPNDVYRLIELGTAHRATSATRMSELSSRSHAIFTIVVDLHHLSGRVVRSSKLNIVDLAGSEKIRLAGVSGQRLEETKKINKSLHELGNVIAALASRRGGGGPNSPRHIPYRNSALTSVLRDSLGGNCRTTLIACLSPSLDAYAETLSTLQFANRAKNIRTRAIVNAEGENKDVVERYEAELAALRRQLQETRMVLANNAAPPVSGTSALVGEDRAAAAEALRRSSETHELELQMRRKLEQRIAELEGTAELSGAATTKEAEVLRYKEFLLKQRDIIISLTTRLNQRDELLLRLQAELEAYDDHVQELEAQLQSVRRDAETLAAPQESEVLRPAMMREASIGSIGKAQAEAYVRAARLAPPTQSDAASSAVPLYRSDLRADVALSADEKLAEVLMLCGGNNNSGTVLSEEAMAELRQALDARVGEIVQQRDAARRMKDAHDHAALRDVCVLCDGLQRALVAALARQSEDPHSDKVVSSLHESYRERLEEVRQSLAKERDERRRMGREMDRIRFEFSHLVERCNVSPAQRSEVSALWVNLKAIEDGLMPSATAEDDVGSSSPSVAMEELRGRLRHVEELLLQPTSNPTSTSQEEEKMDALRRDMRALQVILERRIKPKVEAMCCCLEQEDWHSTKDALTKEASSLRHLVDAALHAMQT